MGSFSAGKSALINAMLQRELLEENQRPETAIASELLFGDEEYIEAVQGTKCDKYSIILIFLIKQFALLKPAYSFSQSIPKPGQNLNVPLLPHFSPRVPESML